MPDTEKLSPGSVGLCAGLSMLALLFYALALATFSDLASSDAAGNGYAQACGAIEIVFLSTLLAVLMLIVGVKGEMPVPALSHLPRSSYSRNLTSRPSSGRLLYRR